MKKHLDSISKVPLFSGCTKKELEKAIERFLEGDQVEDRELLLRAFAAQSAIDWPDLAATFEDS